MRQCELRLVAQTLDARHMQVAENAELRRRATHVTPPDGLSEEPHNHSLTGYDKFDHDTVN